MTKESKEQIMIYLLTLRGLLLSKKRDKTARELSLRLIDAIAIEIGGKDVRQYSKM